MKIDPAALLAARIVEVEWEDTMGVACGWTSLEKVEARSNPDLRWMRSVGYLAATTDATIVLIATRYERPDGDGEILVADATAIPRSAIRVVRDVRTGRKVSLP